MNCTPTFLGGVSCDDHIRQRKVHRTAVCIKSVFQPPRKFYSALNDRAIKVSQDSWFIWPLIRSDCKRRKCGGARQMAALEDSNRPIKLTRFCNLIL